MARPIGSSIRVTKTRGGMSVRATGAYAQALFDAMTKKQGEPAPAPATPAKAKEKANG